MATSTFIRENLTVRSTLVRTGRLCTRAVAWALAGCVAGPLALALFGAARALLGSGPHAASIEEAVAGVLVVTMAGTIVGALLAAPCYLPLLWAWAVCGRRFGWLERTYGGVAAGTGLLAASGAGMLAMIYGTMEPPFGFAGADLVPYAGQMLLLLWAGLLLPRLVIPALRPGAFARSESPAI